MSERQVRWSIAAEEWLKSVDDASVGDVLIVGTGYGGSFAARELAAPDRRVWVLERGREHALGEFAQDIGSLPGQVRIQKAADSAGIGNTDGVSGIIIGSNDYAAAWAMDEMGEPLYASVPGTDRQREFALRTGVNIVMYALTGNYKADQVHVPALLERLGQ